MLKNFFNIFGYGFGAINFTNVPIRKADAPMYDSLSNQDSNMQWQQYVL